MIAPASGRWKIICCTLLLGYLASVASASGYQEGPVVSAGGIRGKATLTGTLPPARIFHLVFSPNMDYCQRISDGKGNRYLFEFKTAEDGGFQNVVVAVVGVDRGKPFDYTPTLEIENCQISPFVMPVRNGHPISIVSKDPVTHDLQSYTLKNPVNPYTFQMFNKPLPAHTRASKEIRFRKGHFIFRTQCGVHDFMQSWGIAIGNPYFAVTGPDGGYSIPDLPPSDYDVISWHPRMEVQVKRVTVPPNGQVTLDFEFKASGVEILEHDLQTSYRLETWLGLRTLVPPSVELQVPNPQVD